jgi:hypothetical protein
VKKGSYLFKLFYVSQYYLSIPKACAAFIDIGEAAVGW